MLFFAISCSFLYMFFSMCKILKFKKPKVLAKQSPTFPQKTLLHHYVTHLHNLYL